MAGAEKTVQALAEIECGYTRPPMDTGPEPGPPSESRNAGADRGGVLVLVAVGEDVAVAVGLDEVLLGVGLGVLGRLVVGRLCVGRLVVDAVGAEGRVGRTVRVGAGSVLALPPVIGRLSGAPELLVEVGASVVRVPAGMVGPAVVGEAPVVLVGAGLVMDELLVDAVGVPEVLVEGAADDVLVPLVWSGPDVGALPDAVLDVPASVCGVSDPSSLHPVSSSVAASNAKGRRVRPRVRCGWRGLGEAVIAAQSAAPTVRAHGAAGRCPERHRPEPRPLLVTFCCPRGCASSKT